MRKIQSQPSLASLTPEERDQIADWLREQTYQAVLDRVRQPRPDGFGLDISVRPLQTLYAKIQKLDCINERLKGKEQLTLEDFDALSLGEKEDLPQTVHDTILETVSDLATSGDNSPSELLALQRLADFPARAELRAERMELEFQKQAHRTEMDQHKKKMAEERLELAKRALALREEKTRASRADSRVTPESSHVPSDELGPYAATLDEIEARAAKKFGFANNHNRSGRNDGALEKETHPRPSAPCAVNESPSLVFPSVLSVSSAPSVSPQPQTPKTYDPGYPSRPTS